MIFLNPFKDLHRFQKAVYFWRFGSAQKSQHVIEYAIRDIFWDFNMKIGLGLSDQHY